MKLIYVNGFSIRQTLDVDFNLIHEHGLSLTRSSLKYYIPKGEVWLDHRYKNEADFLIEVRKTITLNEQSYKNVRKNKSKFINLDAERECLKKFIKHGTPPQFIIKEEKHRGIKIKYVDGSIVRNYFDPEFYLGGHDKVYSYIQKNEIWLDGLMDILDIPHILQHECVERNFMVMHNQTYDAAHDYATATERVSRREVGAHYPGDEDYSSAWTEALLKKGYKNLKNSNYALKLPKNENLKDDSLGTINFLKKLLLHKTPHPASIIK